MKVSVLILTLNEGQNIEQCLSALSWCDDIVVLDSGSTDDTLDIAKRFHTRVLVRKFDNFANQRNYGLAEGKFENDWVLHLDADEVVTPSFVKALRSLQPTDAVDAYHVPSKTMFYGKWLRFAGMYPSYQTRLGRTHKLRFVQVGHGQREDLPGERIGVFPEPYLHFSFSQGLAHWLKRHLRYAEDEIQQIQLNKDLGGELAGNGKGRVALRRRLKSVFNALPLTLRPFTKFFYVYVFRLGFLDGKRGFAYAFMLAVYEGMIAIIGIDRLGKIAPPESNLAFNRYSSGASQDD